MTHSGGWSKGELSISFGFHLDEWQILEGSLTRHCENNLVVSGAESEWGKRYSVESELETPDGRTSHVRIVWNVEMRCHD